MTDPSCLFCKIIAGDIPARKVHEDDLVVAIDDINPVAPVHQLLMPRQHVASAAELSEFDAPMLGRLFAVAARLAAEAGLPERGYRLVSNVGADAGQSVPHLHVHLVGGRHFAWPPG
jgi:diadenosine tetraphosphate (Ap4A) HIT family hydrolase